MGKNLYETPRNRDKWNQQLSTENAQQQKNESGAERLERLRKRHKNKTKES